MNKEYINYLTRREAELKVLKQKHWLDCHIGLEADSAIIDLILKVQQSSSSDEQKGWWLERLEKLSNLATSSTNLKGELAKVEMEYNKLYCEYSKLLEVIKKLKEEMV